MRVFYKAEVTKMFSEGRSGYWWNVLIVCWVLSANYNTVLSPKCVWIHWKSESITNTGRWLD